MALGALRRATRQGATRQGAIRPGAARQGAARQGAARGDQCSWFRAKGLVQVAHREVRLAQALRPVPATQWSWLAHRKKKAILRETLPHCLVALAAAPLLPREQGQRHCRAILLSGRAGRL